MNKFIFLACTLLVFAVMGCNRKYNRIIDDKDKIIPLCYNKVMGISRRTYHLYTYNEVRLKNEYIFDRIEDKKDYHFVLTRDSIRFYPDHIVSITPDGSELYRRQICDYFEKMTKMLSRYHILWFTDNNYYGGHPYPGITFGLDNGEMLEYRPGTDGDLEDYCQLKYEWYLSGSK